MSNDLDGVERAEMEEYRRSWQRNFKKKTLSHLIQEEERWAQLITAHPKRIEEDSKIHQELLDRIDTLERQVIESSKGDCPIAFLIPTFEQAQAMNAWSPEFEPTEAPNGYNSVVNFGGKRSNKTFAVLMNTVLWMVPNDPSWPLFQEHEDWMGRGKYRIFRKPNWDIWNRQGRMVYSDEEPPVSGKNIWHGCPDDDHWKNKLDRNYRRIMPMKWVKRVGKEYKWNLSEKYFETIWDTRLSGKLYGSDIQAWSGEEVFLMNLDEGVPSDKLDEAVMRMRYCQWAYTPQEAANVAERAAIAREVYYGERNLVGQIKILKSKTLDTPDRIMDPYMKQVRKDNAAKMGELGRVSLEGGFFDSSPNVFSLFNRERHVLPVTFPEVMAAIEGKPVFGKPWMEALADANIIRSFDEGLAHPTGGLWGALTSSNEIIIFKEYLESDASIPERCEKIIGLSGNEREPVLHTLDKVTEEALELAAEYAPELLKDRKREEKTGNKVRRYREKMKGMFIRKTFADSKIFRRDPQYPMDSWVENYNREGLKLERASNALPEARCDYVNGLFRTDMSRQHICPDMRTPENPHGYKLYVTMDCVKTIKVLERYLWEQFVAGPRKGDPTGKPDRRADEIPDCLGYLCLGKLKWVPTQELKDRRGYQAA
jgi:hypothetical protein